MRHLLWDLRRVQLLIWNLVRCFAVPALLWLLGRRPSARQLGRRLRRFCEVMGITYLKLGQFLATRFDALPRDVCDELQHLFDAVEPLPYEAVRQRVEAELGRPLGELFASFEREALATGSVAQVHRARSRAGELVAVKVQRPGIEAIFRA